jgi:hypothetical protein
MWHSKKGHIFLACGGFGLQRGKPVPKLLITFWNMTAILLSLGGSRNLQLAPVEVSKQGSAEQRPQIGCPLLVCLPHGDHMSSSGLLRDMKEGNCIRSNSKFAVAFCLLQISSVTNVGVKLLQHSAVLSR